MDRVLRAGALHLVALLAEAMARLLGQMRDRALARGRLGGLLDVLLRGRDLSLGSHGRQVRKSRAVSSVAAEGWRRWEPLRPRVPQLGAPPPASDASPSCSPKGRAPGGPRRHRRRD